MVSKKKIILFTTSTLHHLYFIKILNSIKETEIILFFINDNKEKLTKKQSQFEKNNFFKNIKYISNNKKFFYKNINSTSVIKKIKEINPTLGILFGTKKVNQEFIEIFNNKLINIHRGIMEKYRGLDSEFWALYFKDFKSIGTTIHLVNHELDKGKIIFQKKLILKKNMKCYQLRYYTTMIAANLISKIINMILNNRVVFFKNQKYGKYYSSISKYQKTKACKFFEFYTKKIK